MRTLEGAGGFHPRKQRGFEGPSQAAEKLCSPITFERALLYRLRKNSILPLLLKGHGFSHADKVSQINVGFSHRGTYFRISGEMQHFPSPLQARKRAIRSKYNWNIGSANTLD